jgi:hypothetical protein
MERRFYTNSKWAVMDLGTFSKLSAKTIHDTIKENSKKRNKK